MVTSALRPVQVAVVAALAGSPALVAKVTGIFDGVPDQQPFPYVLIDYFTESPEDALDQDGQECTVTVKASSRYDGWKECDEIIELVDAVLDDQQLNVAGWSTVKTFREMKQQMRDPDGVTRHLIARYRIEAYR